MDIPLLRERAFEHALRSIESATGPLIPFTFVLDANPDPAKRTLVQRRFAAEYLEQALQEARGSITPSLNASMYAIVWDGLATVDARKWDAIFVEVGEATVQEGAIYAQRYVLKEGRFLSKRRRNVAVGEPLRVGATHSRLWTQV